MDLLEGIATTRAIRRYSDRAVEDADLARILFAATRGPSGSNRQPFRFLVLRHGPCATEARQVLGDAGRRLWSSKRTEDGYDAGSGADAASPKARLAGVLQEYFDRLGDAPVIVLACLRRYRDPNPYEGASVYPACQNLLLAARAIGLGGVLTQVHLLAEEPLRAALDIPGDVAVHATITLGWPLGSHGPVRRLPLGELVYEDTWGQPAPWAVEPTGTRHTSAGPAVR